MKRTIVLEAFKHSLPIFLGYLPVGIAFGVLMQQAGYNVLWTGASSIFVYAGSLQFLMVSFLTSTTSLILVALLALLLNSRHIFYGLSFLEKFRSFGFWKYFLIFTLTDENYSLHCAQLSQEKPGGKWAYVLPAAFTWLYWIVATIIGNVLGTLIPFNTQGIDFAQTALFIVILVDQVRGSGSKLPALAAAACSLVSILVFGADQFILPALCLTVAALIVLRPAIAKGGDAA